MNRAAHLRGQIAEAAGRAAEASVARDYLRRGFSLCATRWRGKGGEIDLVAEQAGTYVFVEVKSGPTHACAAERLQGAQIARLHVAAAEFLAALGLSLDTDCRFDVALLNRTGRIEIHENALMA
jgi:putative endonuclease